MLKYYKEKRFEYTLCISLKSSKIKTLFLGYMPTLQNKLLILFSNLCHCFLVQWQDLTPGGAADLSVWTNIHMNKTTQSNKSYSYISNTLCWFTIKIELSNGEQIDNLYICYTTQLTPLSNRVLQTPKITFAQILKPAFVASYDAADCCCRSLEEPS